jgi:hypothetical protein
VKTPLLEPGADGARFPRWPDTIVGVEGGVPAGQWGLGAETPENGEANTVDTGVAGLVLVRTAPGGQWRLVHEVTGLLVSRSAVSDDTQDLRRLAYELGPLADWTQRELPLPGPALRQAVETAARRCGLPLGAVSTEPVPATVSSEEPQTARVELPTTGVEPQSQLEAAQRDLELVSRVLRLVHTSVPPGILASAIADLDASQRARLRELLTAGDTGTRSDAVIQSIPSSPPTRPAVRGTPPPRRNRPGSATG